MNKQNHFSLKEQETERLNFENNPPIVISTVSPLCFMVDNSHISYFEAQLFA